VKRPLAVVVLVAATVATLTVIPGVVETPMVAP
jgi:hypothetical protein